MAINLNITNIFKQKEETETLYYVGDLVRYYHDVRGEMVTGVIEAIDWDGSISQVFADGIARAYVCGVDGYDFADYVEASDLRPAGTYQEAI